MEITFYLNAFVVIFSKWPAGHALKTPAIGNCNTTVSIIIIILYYNLVIL